MELRVRRDTFLAELNPMQGIVERRTTIPVLSHLLLSAAGDRLRLAATDLDVSLTSSVPAEVSRDGALAVQAKKFAEIVRSVVAEEIWLTLEDDRALVVQAGKARFRMHGLPAADFPTLPTVDGKPKLEIPLPALRRLVGKILFAVSGEDSRFQLSGALLKIKGSSVELVARMRSPNCALRPRSRRYDGRKSWPHSEMQCASSTTMRDTPTPARKSRKPPSSASGAT